MATLTARPPWVLKLDNMISVPSKIFDYWDDISEWKVTIDKSAKTVTWEEFKDLNIKELLVKRFEKQMSDNLGSDVSYMKTMILLELEKVLDKKIVEMVRLDNADR